MTTELNSEESTWAYRVGDDVLLMTSPDSTVATVPHLILGLLVPSCWKKQW